MINIVTSLRKLAKSTYYLNKLSVSKDMLFNLFDNSGNLSNLQMKFLSFLYMYKSINDDISSKRVSDKVLKDPMFEDSYMLWRMTHDEKVDKKQSHHKFFGLVDDTIELKEKKG